MTIQEYLESRGITAIVGVAFCSPGKAVSTDRGKRNFKVTYRRDDKQCSRMFYHPNATYWGHEDREARALRSLAEVEAKEEHTCGRCGGKGGWSGWPGFTCYDCNGSGVDPKFWREFDLEDA